MNDRDGKRRGSARHRRQQDGNVLFTAAAPLLLVALMLGPVEQTALIFFSICVVASLIGGNPFRGLTAAAFGFVFAAVGQSPEEARPA